MTRLKEAVAEHLKVRAAVHGSSVNKMGFKRCCGKRQQRAQKPSTDFETVLAVKTQHTHEWNLALTAR